MTEPAASSAALARYIVTANDCAMHGEDCPLIAYARHILDGGESCRDACTCSRFRQIDPDEDPELCWCSHYRREHPEASR